MSNSIIHIAGIGTDVGKTIASVIVVESLQADYWKPIQCGELENSDTMKVRSLVQNTQSNFLEESFRLQAPQSPHYAAELENISIHKKDIVIPEITGNLVIEGAGGICVPFNASDFLIDILPTDTPIVLVSRHYLGSINHTLLSLNFLKSRGFTKIGLIFIGAEKPSTEKVILAQQMAVNIGRIPWIDTVTKDFISKQAVRLQKPLESFIRI